MTASSSRRRRRWLQHPSVPHHPCEPLEPRQLLVAPLALAAFPLPAPGTRASLAGHTLTLTGTPRADSLTLAADGRGRVTLNGHALLRHRKPIAAASLRSIVIRAGAGDDRVDLSAVIPSGFPRLARAVVFADAGDDSILGSACADLLSGGDGLDTLRGLGGDDQLLGGGGTDWLLGNAGDDRILGGADDDLLYGGAGDDLLRGEAGEDNLCGAGSIEEDADLPDPVLDDDGTDTLDGGAGEDRYFLLGPAAGRFTIREAPGPERDELNACAWDYPLNLDLTLTTPQPQGAGGWIRFACARGFEILRGGRFDDALYGDELDNVLDGQEGDNLLVGRGGNDNMGSFDGDDTLRGDEGDDDFWLFGGDDMAIGGAGSDAYHWVGFDQYGRDTVVEAPDADADTLDLSDAPGGMKLDLGSTEPQVVFGSGAPGGYGLTLVLSDAAGIENVLTGNNSTFAWADTIRGNSRPNLIATFFGDDAIDAAGGGIDTVFAGAGADAVTADPGDEVLADADPGR